MCKQLMCMGIAFAALACAQRASAQDRAPSFSGSTVSVATPLAGPLRAAIEGIRFDSVDHPEFAVTERSSSATQSTRGSSVIGKVVLATVGGVAGFLGGGMIGAKIEGPCSCDDPGFKGAIIGAPIGAVVGAVAGWKVGGWLGG